MNSRAQVTIYHMKITTQLITLVLLTAIFSNGAFALTKEEETARNALLIDNAAKADADLAKKNAGAVQQEIRTIGGGTAKTIDTKNLTDQQKQLSENFIHQGKANAIIDAGCAGDMKTVCNGNEGKTKFLGVDSKYIKVASQMYAMFSALAGEGMGKITAKPEAPASGTTPAAGGTTPPAAGADTANAASGTKDAAAKKDEGVSDYCKYIPVATEGIATAVQSVKTKELGSEEYGNGDTSQKDSLLKAAKSHDSRAKMAQIQAAGWFGGAACYAINGTYGNWNMDKNLIIKMGAATFLGAFYQNEVSANKGYADKTRAIANALPGKGDCNPITDRLCYCSQPSTENDPTYCAENLHKNTIAATSYRVACTTNTLKIDPNCTCEKTNTCFETYLEAQGEGILNLGMGYANSPFKPIRSLARGELVGSTINTSSYDSTAAIAKKALKEAADKLGDYESSRNKDVSDALMAKGIPGNVARLIANNPPSQASINAATGRFNGSSATQYASVAPSKKGSNIVDFSGGNGLGYKGKSGGSDNAGEDFLAKLKPGGKAAPTNSKILEFAQKAEAQARQNGQIRKEDTPLFEIISLRYRTSGRALLGVDAN